MMAIIYQIAFLFIFLFLCIVLESKIMRLEYEFEKIKVKCGSYERRLNLLLHDKVLTDDDFDGDIIKEILKKQEAENDNEKQSAVQPEEKQ